MPSGVSSDSLASLWEEKRKNKMLEKLLRRVVLKIVSAEIQKNGPLLHLLRAQIQNDFMRGSRVSQALLKNQLRP